MSALNENTVLAPYQHHPSPDSSMTGFRNRLIEFRGDEGEDYRHFQKRLESFFALSDINKEHRKILILQTQLQHGARIFFDTLYSAKPDISKCTYKEFAEALHEEYITPQLIRRYQLAFNSMSQGSEEHPRVYLGRLKEAAILAEIKDSTQIEIRFQTGLMPNIITQCKLMGASTFNDYLKCADGYWDAYYQRNISIVDSPFNARLPISSPNSIPSSSITGNNSSNLVFGIKNNNQVLTESPTITKLTNSMEALQLNHMESNEIHDPKNPNIVKMDDSKFEEKLRMLVDESIKRHFAKTFNNNDRRNNRPRNDYNNNSYNENYRRGYNNNHNDNYRSNNYGNNNYGNNNYGNNNYRNNNDNYNNNNNNDQAKIEKNHSNDHRNYQTSKN